MKQLIFLIIMVSLGFIFVLPAQAYAYIDPGIGGLIFQLFGLIFVFILGMWTGLFARVKTFFLRFFKPSKSNSPNDNNEDKQKND